MEFWLHILILIAIYTIAANSLNLIAGYAGLLSVAHAAYVGSGAYVSAILMMKLGVPFGITLFCAVLIAAALAYLSGLPALRVHDDYFVLATFALQVIATSVLTNWVELTGGPMGIAGIPQPQFLPISADPYWTMLLLCWFIAGGVLLILNRLVHSPYGRVLRAIREDEVFAQALGKDVTRTKIITMVIGSGFAAVAGSLYAVYMTYIDPSSFTIQESIFLLSIVIVGGAGNLWGSTLGAVVLVTLPELLRFIGLPSAVAAGIRQVIYGGLLVVMMVWRPQGMIGEFDFRRG